MKDRICQDSSCEVRARQGVAALRERIATTGQAFFGGQLVSRAASAGRDLLRTLFGLPLLACLAAGAQAQGTTDVVSFAPAAGAPTTITEGGSPVEFLLGSDNVAVPPGTFFNLNVSGSVNRFDYQMDQWSGSSWVRVSLESESTNTLILGSAYLFPSRLRLTALGDSVLEGDETLTLTLRQGEGYQVGSPSSASLTVVDANRAPSFAIDARTFTIAEDAAPGSDVGTPLPAATDPNGDSLIYSMEGTDASLFSFNSATRQITLQAALDFEAKPSLSVRVKADDGRGGTDTVAVTIDLTDVSEPPLRPGKPTALAVSATSLKVSWAAPDSTGRPTITGYDVRWRDNLGSLDWIDAPRVTGTSATITGLKANMEYVLQVRSVNPDGESDWSSPGHGDTGDHGRGGTDPGEGGGTDPGEGGGGSGGGGGGGSGGSGGGGDSAAVRIFHAEPVAEGEPLRFRVGLDAPARRRLDLLASTAGQTAADGADYLGFSRRPVMVAPGASEVWLEVPTARDADDGEGDEKLTVTLAVAPGSAPASVVRSEAQGTILDGPPPEAVVPLFLADAEARHGFVRVLDRGWRGGPVTVAATDDGGAAADSMLRLPTQGAAHFNSSDLELGNTVKGLAPGTGMPTRGDWRLRLTGADAAALAYARTRDGFVTPLAGTVPAADGGLFVAFFNPGSNFRQVSLLRLHNPGEEDARITVEGTDDSGASPGTPVRLTVPGGESVTLSARELEGGAAPGIDLDGALGDGRGKWRLSVTSDRPVEAMSLLESPTGHLANLSAGTAPRTEGDGGTARTLVPLFPSASDPDRRQGFIRVVNRGSEAAEVRIEARDDAGTEYPAVTLALDAEEAVHLNSQDLENGAASKGLTAGAGPGEGHWRLEATAPSEVVVLAYLRHLDDGFLTGMNAMAPLVDDNVHQVDFLNPGSNHRQASLLRLVNPGAEPAQVAVSGTDDAGEPGAAEVRLALPANTVRMLTSAELEDGGERLEGALGDGTGKWRLRVVSDRPIQVMSLLASPTGHLANLSVGFGDGAADQPGMQDNRP